MMQKQFITPIKFWLAGVIAITALFTFSTKVIAGQKPFAPIAADEREIVNLNGEDLCFILDRRTCQVQVKCEDWKTRLPYRSIREVLGLPRDAIIFVPRQSCPTFDYDNGKINTEWRCSGGRCYPR